MKKFFAILSLLLICGNVFAQTNTKIDSLGEGLSYSKISSRLIDIEKLTKKENPNVEAMTSELPYLNDMAIKINVVRNNVSDEIKLIEKRIEALEKENAELKEHKLKANKLLKAAVEDMTGMQFGEECKVCSKKLLPNECPIHNNVSCILGKDFKWRYADEALKLLGGSENVGNLM